MLRIIYETIRESLFRRMGLALLLISSIAAGVFLWFVRYQKLSDGSVVVLVGGTTQQAAAYAVSQFNMLLTLTSNLWMFIGIFACAPLLTSFLEKGWAEMLLSKGIARWRVLLGRYLGALIVYTVALVLLDAVPAFYFWLRTGVKPWRFLAGAGVLLFSFAVTLSLMLLFGISSSNAALPVLIGFLQLFLSSLLGSPVTRKAMLNFFTSPLVRSAIEWIYRVLPKNSELNALAQALLRDLPQGIKHVDVWWPVWTSAAFMLGALACAQFFYHRKDF